MDLNQNYQKEFQKLNSEQKQAVETIEGPVLVLAGAGTGKTQTIALRIANILLKTQTNPASILALTFTESGVLSMRKRLLSILGTMAYQIKIHTFHSYCNELVLNSPESFSLSPASQPITDLERGQIIRQAINLLPSLSPLRPWGDNYFFQTEVLSQIQTLKREGFSPDAFKSLLTTNEQSLSRLKPFYDFLKSFRATEKVRPEILSRWQAIEPSDDPFYILLASQFALEKTGYHLKVSDLKSALTTIFDNLNDQIPKLQNLVNLYDIYQQKLHNLNRYDYEDMILLVLKKFSSDPYFLSKQQELCQYILVDEYQDTNTSQNNLLYALGSYDSSPNLFVVGDDDQSIFRFQGASLENIFSFYQYYKENLQIITLHHNYRSQSHILSHANQLINQNQNRLTSWLPDVDKTTISKSTHPAQSIFFTNVPNLNDELYLISQTIKNLIQNKTTPDEIAVLVKTNRQIEEVSNYLSSQKIPNFPESSLDIFNQNYILRFLQVIQACFNPNQENLSKLYAIKLRPRELFDYIHFQKSNSHIRRLNRLIAISHKDISRLNPGQAFLNIMQRFKFLPKKYKNLFAIKTLSDQFLALSSQNLEFGQIFTILLEQKSQKLSLPYFIPDEFRQNKIRIMTVHKSKGQEFEHVFIPFLNDKTWGNTTNRQKIRLPPGVIPPNTSLLGQSGSNEDDRRLFYVALTRAKIQLYLSSSKFGEGGKEILPSLFISELNQDLICNFKLQTADSTKSTAAYFDSNRIKNSNFGQFSHYIKQYLTNNYTLTASDLNSYLVCPHCFYYQRIVNLPIVKNKHLLYGTAIHTALTQYYRQKLDLASLIKIFNQNLLPHLFPSNLEYQESKKKGEEMLNLYYPILQSEDYKKVILEHNFKREHLTFDKVPITGKIDKLKYVDNGLILSDFKTGRPGDYLRYPNYERQLLFYYLLCQQSAFLQLKPNQLAIEYLTPNTVGEFETKFFEISKEKLDHLKDEIKQVYEKILNLDFSLIGKTCHDPSNLHSIK